MQWNYIQLLNKVAKTFSKLGMVGISDHQLLLTESPMLQENPITKFYEMPTTTFCIILSTEEKCKKFQAHHFAALWRQSHTMCSDDLVSDATTTECPNKKRL